MITEVDGGAEGVLETPPSDDWFPKAWAAVFPKLGQDLALAWAHSDLKMTWACLSSPGAALAAHGACGTVALLHDHADVGFHELGHIHHLPGRADRTQRHGRDQIQAPNSVTSSDCPPWKKRQLLC